MTSARLVPWDTTAAESTQESLRSVERAIDCLAAFQDAEETDTIPLEERLEILQRAESLLAEARSLVADGRGAIARRIAHEAIGRGEVACRKCFHYRPLASMRAIPFSYGTQGDESVRYICSECCAGP